MRAGTTVRSRIPPAWWFSATGYVDGAAVGGAGDDDAELDVERHALLDDARHAELGEGGAERGLVGDADLALAVVAEAGRLDDRRERRRRSSPPAHPRRASGRRASRRNAFSARRSWAMATARGRRGDDDVARQALEGRGRRVLELRRDDRAHRRRAGRGRRGRRTAPRCGRRRRARPVPPDRARARRCRSPSGGPRRRCSGRAARRRARRSSPAGRSGVVIAGGGSVDDAAWSWRAVRSAASASASASSSAASRATANRPAFVAPASPMANVATGMPAGIWTIDSSESCPCRWRDGTGTPSTGTVVLAASIPGRWAAPPAPAMIARMPRLTSRLGVGEHLVGHAVGADDLGLVGDAEALEHGDGRLHRRPVARRAHQHADDGRARRRHSPLDR